MNNYLKALEANTNYTHTENGALTHKSTLNAVLDMFALGGSYRSRSDDDVIALFAKAFQEDEVLALKCLFYLYDVRCGQGQRRFFRVCAKWLAKERPEAIARNLKHIPTFGRWDMLYAFDGTALEKQAYTLMANQLMLDLDSKTPSLLAKWLKSINTSNAESCRLGHKTRKFLGMTAKQYRKTLAILRNRIKVLERLMSEKRWDEIEFDKIPSRAGLIYRNAFARNDFLKARYEQFMKNKETRVNANVLNPVDIVEECLKKWSLTETERMALNKYWENLKDYYDGREENGLAVVDVSGSMNGKPMAAAIAMGAYIAERGHGPFANNFITFSEQPHLVKFIGADIYAKANKARDADWGNNTNLKAVFDLMLSTALANHTAQKDMPTRLYIFSDMEFDEGLGYCTWHCHDPNAHYKVRTLLEDITQEWGEHGYKLPNIIFWNLNARNDNIPALGEDFSYVSGFSMNMVEQILSGKTNVDLMLEKLNSDRYKVIN